MSLVDLATITIIVVTILSNFIIAYWAPRYYPRYVKSVQSQELIEIRKNTPFVMVLVVIAAAISLAFFLNLPKCWWARLKWIVPIPLLGNIGFIGLLYSKWRAAQVELKDRAAKT